jgi:tRNA-binding protein
MEDIKPAAIKPAVEIEVLERLDLRFGTIVSVDEVVGSKKLVKLTVNFGDHSRSILAGMKQEREVLSEIEGVQALFLVNLEPKKMAGEMSEGMLVDAGYADSIRPSLIVPERPLPDGTRAG